MCAPSGDLGESGEVVVEVRSLAAHPKLGRLLRESHGFRLVEFTSPGPSEGRQHQEPVRPTGLHDSSHDSRGEDVLTVDGRASSPPECSDPDRPAVLLHLDER
jgi:hypothetical protein